MDRPDVQRDIETIKRICKLIGVDIPVYSLKLEWSVADPVIRAEIGVHAAKPIENQG